MKNFTLLAAAFFGSLPLFAFEYEGLQYEDLGDGTAQVSSAAGATGDVVVPQTVYDENGNALTVVALKKSSFRDTQIASLVLPESLQRIGSSAFAHSTLKRIEFGNQLEVIERNAFYDCQNLDNVVLPASLREIGEMAFIYCSSLMKISIPEGIERLNSATFKECVRLEKVELPSTLREFEDQVFSTCYALESIHIPEGVKVIPESFCYQCTSLTDIQFPNTLEEIRNGAFGLCYTLEHISLPNSLFALRNGAFTACYSLEEVEIPSSVTTLGSDIFYQNSSMRTITLGENVEILGYGSLGAWEVLPDNSHQWVLSDIYSLNPIPPHFEYDGFARPEPDFFSLEEFTDEEKANFYASVTLHVPADALSAYQTADLWRAFSNIVGDAVGIDSPIAAAEEVESGDGMISVSGAEAGSQVSLYALSGRLVARQHAGEAGSVHFDALPAGLYVVKTAVGSRKAIVR